MFGDPYARAAPAAVLALFFALAGTGTALAEAAVSKTAARMAAFYRSATIDRTLTGEALQSSLDKLATEPGEQLSVRVLAVPSACRSVPHMLEAWEGRIDAVIAVKLWQPSSGKSYYLSASLDFGGLEIPDPAAGVIAITWYECAQDGAYVLRANEEGRDFLLLDGDTPLWGFSLKDE